MRYLAGLRTIPSILANLFAAPVYLLLMLAALAMFVSMSRSTRPRQATLVKV